jgi:Zn-dependent metalloprotease
VTSTGQRADGTNAMLLHMGRSHSFNCITPPHLLDKLLESDDAAIREAAQQTLITSAALRGERKVRLAFTAMANPGHGERTIWDAQHRERLETAELVRSETSGQTTDQSVNRAFDHLGTTRKFYANVFARNSVDGFGMRLNSYVHYGRRFDNAFWDGQEMVFGDGDGRLFADFTLALDVIGHELTHGVTQTTAALLYHNQSGALNESISDVFGSLIKQWSKNQTAEDADWLIGVEIFTPGFTGDALRSMKDPGHAYDNPTMGKDPQPAHMRGYVELPDTARGDNGGVHINSGIPNKAFYLVATNIGGNAWQTPGHIWYESLKASNPTTDFSDFAQTTVSKAAQLYGVDAQGAVQDAWEQVGIRVKGLLPRPTAPTGEGSLEALQNQLVELSAGVKALAEEVHGGNLPTAEPRSGRAGDSRQAKGT